MPGQSLNNVNIDPITPQYLADLIAWTAIGARTAEALLLELHNQYRKIMPTRLPAGKSGAPKDKK